MKKNRLLIALVVLIGLSVAVAMTRRSHQAATTLEAPKTSVPTIKKEQITELRIERPGKPLILMRKQGTLIGMVMPVQDLASKIDLDQALDALANLKIVSIAATNKDSHKQLEVDAEHAVRVTAKAGDQKLIDLYVGASKTGGTMIRLEGEDNVLTAKGSLRYVFDKDVREFRNRDVTDFDAKNVTSLEVSSAKGDFKFVKDGDNWAQAPGEKPIAKFDPGKVSRLADAFSSLRAVDFAEESDTDAVTGLDKPLGRVVMKVKEVGTVELIVGKQHKDGSEHFAKRVDGDVVYRITNFSSERMMADAKAFEKAEQPAAPAPGDMKPGGGIPGLEGMPPMAGAENLPPELLEKLKAMQAKGEMPPGHE